MTGKIPILIAIFHSKNVTVQGNCFPANQSTGKIVIDAVEQFVVIWQPTTSDYSLESKSYHRSLLARTKFDRKRITKQLKKVLKQLEETDIMKLIVDELRKTTDDQNPIVRIAKCALD